eukprot:Gb_31989 [translate_table: standard]
MLEFLVSALEFVMVNVDVPTGFFKYQKQRWRELLALIGRCLAILLRLNCMVPDPEFQSRGTILEICKVEFFLSVSLSGSPNSPHADKIKIAVTVAKLPFRISEILLKVPKAFDAKRVLFLSMGKLNAPTYFPRIIQTLASSFKIWFGIMDRKPLTRLDCSIEVGLGDLVSIKAKILMQYVTIQCMKGRTLPGGLPVVKWEVLNTYKGFPEILVYWMVKGAEYLLGVQFAPSEGSCSLKFSYFYCLDFGGDECKGHCAVCSGSSLAQAEPQFGKGALDSNSIHIVSEHIDIKCMYVPHQDPGAVFESINHAIKQPHLIDLLPVQVTGNGSLNIPGRYESFWKELDLVKQKWKNRQELKVEEVGVGVLFALECYAWFCVGEIAGRGFTMTGYHV